MTSADPQYPKREALTRRVRGFGVLLVASTTFGGWASGFQA